jgi:multisubunit Na+/H+ antiporter MnhE subunit
VKRRSSYLPLLVSWPLLFGAWVVLISVRSLSELLIGVGCSAAAAAGFEAARRAGVVRFRPRPAWFGPVARVPWRIVADTIVVFRTLPARLGVGRPPRSRMRAIAFEGGAGFDARSEARRSLALWLASSSPNSIALGVDDDANVLVVHELVESDVMPAGSELARP